MSRIFVAGLGAVSPAGWSVAAMREALELGNVYPGEALAGGPPGESGGKRPRLARLVPAPVPRPDFISHPRLRRSSPITHYAAAAALEAVAGIQSGGLEERRIGLIVCLQSGCVQYSCRFYDETLKDPATASPLLFPETVHAAPASHIATLLGKVTLVSSQVGDPSCFLQATALAAQWLGEERVDFCVVIGAEEPNWITADGLGHFDRSICIGAGAGAICLCRDPRAAIGVELIAITDAHTYSSVVGRRAAAVAMRKELTLPAREGSRAELLCDGLVNSVRMDRVEAAVWSDWTGARLSPGRILGQGLMAGAAWQCVAACDALAVGRFQAASVSLVGFNQQAIGARFQAVTQ